MVKEIEKDILTYYPLQGGEKAVRKILKNINVKTIKTKITKAKWLDKLLHGHILANTYARPIIFLSLKDCITFVPLKPVPNNSTKTNPEPIYLVHVNNNHWILAHVEGSNNVKPIPPLMVVSKTSSQTNQDWSFFLREGQELYSQDLNAQLG
jgi:hypothetical protein